MGFQTSVLDKLRRYMSVKELSEILGVSRPSLYTYARIYDEGVPERIPVGVRKIFDLTAEGQEDRLLRLLYEMKEHYVVTVNNDAIVTKKESPGIRAHSTKTDMRTICLHDSEKFMVIFYNIPDVIKTELKVYINDAGGYYCIGTYRPEKDRSFVKVDDLIPAKYYYEIVQECADGIHKSPLKQLVDESDELR